jgi:hypothetical protein
MLAKVRVETAIYVTSAVFAFSLIWGIVLL